MSRKPLHCIPEPCSSCPYRRDTPAGVWDKTEYEKLRGYDDNSSFATFLCHQSREIGKDTACRGWMAVHCESVAVRLAILKGDVTPAQLYADVASPLYKTGNEAADAGIRGVKRPSKKAKHSINRLSKRRKRK